VVHIFHQNHEKSRFCHTWWRHLHAAYLLSALLVYEKGMGHIQSNQGKTGEETTKGSHGMPKCSESTVIKRTNPTCKVVRSKTKLIQLGNRNRLHFIRLDGGTDRSYLSDFEIQSRNHSIVRLVLFRFETYIREARLISDLIILMSSNWSIGPFKTAA